MRKISWTDRVREEEVLHVVEKEGNDVQTVKSRKVNWIGHILRMEECREDDEEEVSGY